MHTLSLNIIVLDFTPSRALFTLFVTLLPRIILFFCVCILSFNKIGWAFCPSFIHDSRARWIIHEVFTKITPIWWRREGGVGKWMKSHSVLFVINFFFLVERIFVLHKPISGQFCFTNTTKNKNLVASLLSYISSLKPIREHKKKHHTHTHDFFFVCLFINSENFFFCFCYRRVSAQKCFVSETRYWIFILATVER